MRRNLVILVAGNALAASGGSLVMFVGGIVGGRLAPTPTVATLPVALFVVGVATTTVLASLLMERFGRRAGFVFGALLGAVASVYGAASISMGSFALFCSATFVLGANVAFVVQYRFAAAESVPRAEAGRAVSFVLAGGIVAGFLGPELARRARGVTDVEYAGAFLVLAVLYVVVAMLMVFVRRVEAANGEAVERVTRPPSAIVARPEFALAAAAGMVAYGSMSLLMTATPLSMHVFDGHSLDAAAFVIQSHAVAMYLPSFFTGAIVDRFGTRRVMLLGVLAILGCVVTGASSHTLRAYWTGLVLLGIGWNFLFLGGTVLLARAWTAADRFRAQAANDLLVFGTQAAASLGSGAALHVAGWRAMNLIVLPGLLVLTVLILRLRLPDQAHVAPAAMPAPDTLPG
jgi:MFS family permease